MADNGIEIEGLVFEAGAGRSDDSLVDARSRAVTPALTEDDLALDRSLRPKRLGDYLGQTKIKESLAILIGAAQARGDVVDHILFSGPPGLGKTTLASALSEDTDTLEDVYEPYLMQQGLLVRTPKGRICTERAYDHLGIKVPSSS